MGDASFPTFVDIDGDSDLDLVVGTADGSLRSFANYGGVFTELTGAANPFTGLDIGVGSAPAFADLEGDADLDLVVGSNRPAPCGRSSRPAGCLPR